MVGWRSMRTVLLCATALGAGSVPALAQGVASSEVETVVSPSPAAVHQVPPVRSVVLSSAGLAEYTRLVEPNTFVNGESVVLLPTRLDDVNDTLKSFLALGAGLSGVEMRLPSSAAVEDVFAGLPFGPHDLTSLEGFLARLPGADVEVRTGEGPVITGRVMGVTRSDACEEGAVCPPVLLLRGVNGGLQRITLETNVTVDLVDEATQTALDRGLDALEEGALSDSKTVRVVLRADEDAEGPVVLSTVLRAPVWKTAYRAFINPQGGASVSAWAIVENATQEDWEDVDLTLVSGSPRTLETNLYARLYGNRERAGSPHQGSSFFAAPQSLMAAQSARGVVQTESLSFDVAYERMAMETGVEGEDGIVGARFALPKAVSLQAGEVLSLPFLAEDLEAQAVAYTRVDSLSNSGDLAPMATALNVRNTTQARLPAGVLTLYEQEQGFAGDTQVPMMDAGSVHTLVFGQDSGARVGRSEKTSSVVRTIAPGDGVITVIHDRITTTSVRVEAPGERGLEAIVDLAFSEGQEVSVEGAQVREETVNGGERVLRASRALDAQEVWTFTTTQRTPQREEWYVGDLGDAQLLAWAETSPDAATRDWLRKAAALRADVGSLEQAIRQLDERRTDVQADQERRRGMLEVIGQGTPAHDRFLTEVLEVEDTLMAMGDERAALQERLDKAREAFALHVQGA